MKVLDKTLIQLDVEVTSAEEAIRYMSDILVREGYVKEGYAECVIKREKEYPTGLIGDGCGIAIPHTNPEYVLKPAICILIPKDPVLFTLMGTRDKEVMAEIIMPLVIKDNKMQIDILKKVMDLLKDNRTLYRIRDCRDKDQILEMLSFLEE
ncbi:PTS sugar transporter subunit IIA [Clostridium sp. Marseille-P3244]|uniref:PTS sugar transporter subunit IIA n=1 Tax=Clostridium sp. Marseille-P3244 TaxID=1871020 RepID=UPI0009304C50|nr:PTS sugar transporter subunit IIA [Clostridium sp. Marseille-P3244]